MDPDPGLALNPDQSPDPTPFFTEVKNAKKKFHTGIFSFKLLAGTLSSILKI
jgi:hypothetical protein